MITKVIPCNDRHFCQVIVVFNDLNDHTNFRKKRLEPCLEEEVSPGMLKSKSCPIHINQMPYVQSFSMVSLKVDNLTYRTNDRDLEYLFEKYGKVKR